MTISAATALNQLRQHPKTFLEENVLAVAQFPNGSGVLNNVILHTAALHFPPLGQRYGSMLGSSSMKPAQLFTFAANALVGSDSTQVNVQLVQMYGFSSAGNIQWYPLAAAPDIMITTKLTGCSFLVRVNFGAVECAHIQPNDVGNPPQDGRQLRSVLSMLHAGNYSKLYGRGRTGAKGYDDSEAATIVGVRRANQWEIYAQRQANQMNVVKSVELIFHE